MLRWQGRSESGRSGGVCCSCWPGPCSTKMRFASFGITGERGRHWIGRRPRWCLYSLLRSHMWCAAWQSVYLDKNDSQKAECRSKSRRDQPHSRVGMAVHFGHSLGTFETLGKGTVPYGNGGFPESFFARVFAPSPAVMGRLGWKKTEKGTVSK